MRNQLILTVLAISMVLMLMTRPGLARWELVLDNISGPGSVSETPPHPNPDSGDQSSPTPEPTFSQPECLHVVRQGETLSGIARLRLGQASGWRELATSNDLPADGRVNHGTILRLPCYEPVTSRETETRDLATAIRETKAELETRSLQQREEIVEAQLNNPVVSVSSIAETGEDLTAGSKPEFNNSQDDPVSLEGEIPEESIASPDSDSVTGEEGIPVWEAEGGDLLDEVIAAWALEAGFRLIIRDRWSWKLDYDYRYSGKLKEAISELLSGYSHSSPGPVVTFYTNDVIVLSIR